MDFAYLLFTEYLQFNPDDPKWLGRDRFILSAGHESMLLYSMLHMSGWLEMDEIKKFRTHSKTPGHPENTVTPGVECTTGPLGQGAAMSVGFAAAAKHFRHSLDQDLFGYHTWVLLGDGCMQEEVTLGAASLAGHLGLDKLIWFYDRNKIQISGEIDRSASDDYRKVFEGSGWDVLEANGHDLEQLREAMDHAVSERSKPLLIIGDTTIANGAHSLAGSEKTHGSPLPAEERQKTFEALGLSHDQAFQVSEAAALISNVNLGKKREAAEAWNAKLEACNQKPGFKKLFEQCFINEDFSELPTLEWTHQNL